MPSKNLKHMNMGYSKSEDEKGVGPADWDAGTPESLPSPERPPLRHIDKYVRPECPCLSKRYTIAVLTCVDGGVQLDGGGGERRGLVLLLGLPGHPGARRLPRLRLPRQQDIRHGDRHLVVHEPAGAGGDVAAPRLRHHRQDMPGLRRGRDVPGVPRHLALLGAAARALPPRDARLLRLVRRRRAGHAAVRHAGRRDQLAGALLLLRRGGAAVVPGVAVAELREAVQAPEHQRARAAVHRAVAGAVGEPGDAHHVHDAVGLLPHLAARLRHRRRQLLPLLELLPARALPGALPAELLQHDHRGDGVRGRAAAPADDDHRAVRRAAGGPRAQEGLPDHHQRAQAVQLRRLRHGGVLLHGGRLRADQGRRHRRAHRGRRLQRLRHLRVQREPPGHRAALRQHPDGDVQRHRHHRRPHLPHRHRQHHQRPYPRELEDGVHHGGDGAPVRRDVLRAVRLGGAAAVGGAGGDVTHGGGQEVEPPGRGVPAGPRQAAAPSGGPAHVAATAVRDGDGAGAPQKASTTVADVHRQHDAVWWLGPQLRCRGADASTATTASLLQPHRARAAREQRRLLQLRRQRQWFLSAESYTAICLYAVRTA